MRFTEFFKEKFSYSLPGEVSVKYRDEFDDSNNLGTLSGVDLDSNLFSGYIYFWDKGYLDFMVYNISEEKVELPIKIIETKDFKDDKIISEVLDFFRHNNQ